MSIVAVPEPLRDKLGPEGTKALVELLNHTLGRSREDLALLLDQKLDRRFAELDVKFAVIDQKFVLLEERFERRLAEVAGALKADLLRWMFVFWVTQLSAILGVLFAFFRP